MYSPNVSPAPRGITNPVGLEPTPLATECLDTLRAALRYPTTDNKHVRRLLRSAAEPRVALSLYLEFTAMAVPFLEGREASDTAEPQCVDCAFRPLQQFGLMVPRDVLAWRCVSSRAALIAVGLRMDPTADEIDLLRDDPRSLVRASYEFVRWLSSR